MANNHSSLTFLFLSFILFLSNGLRKVEMAYGLEEKSAKLDADHMLVIELNSLIPAKGCSTATEDSKTSSKVQLANKYGECSPLKQKKTSTPSLHQVLQKDQARIKYLQSKKAGNDMDSTHNLATDAGAEVTTDYGSGDFLFEIGLGTPEQTSTVILDTGSDLTWVQCLPCSDYCLPQEGAYFNPADSSTYSNVACGSSECSQLTAATYRTVACTTNCEYKIIYGDSSYSEGNLATEALTISNDVFHGYAFGCGQDQSGDFGGADGLMGFSRNEYFSVVYQTSSAYGEYFAYCLPSTSSYTGYLKFGTTAETSSSGYTPLQTSSTYPTFYFVDLTGIYVGGELLDVSSSVYTKYGTIIDSGTTLTYLPTTAYSALVTAFASYMTDYPSVHNEEGLEDCYNFAGYSSVTVPSIVFQLSGYNFKVASSGIFYQITPNIYCLGFSSVSNEFSIFGNTQQLTYEVSYNVAGGELGFIANSCS